MISHDNFQDFTLFLYIHIAYADGTLHSSEESMIIHKIPRLFPTENNLQEKLNAAIGEYRKLNQEEVTKTIETSFKHFDHIQFEQKYKVYTDMYDVLNADGKVDEAERKALDTLKEIIAINASA